MAIKFPSADFFQVLASRMNVQPATCEKLGFCDTALSVRQAEG